MDFSSQTGNDARFNVRDFGARGDGTAADSEPIQRAIDAAGEVKGSVYFPAGTYLCHDLKIPEQVALISDPAWIFRSDAGGAVLQLDDENADCLLNITGAYGVRISGLMLCGLPDARKEIHGILLDNRERFSPKEDTIVIDDTKVQRFSGHGVWLNRIWLFIIRHSSFFANRGCGVQIYGWDGFVTDNQFSGNGRHGFGCETCGSTVMFTANRVEWNRGYGLYLINGDAWNVTGNSFDRNFSAGLYAENISATSVTGNLFRRCGKDRSLLDKDEKSCQVHLRNCRGITFVSNTMRAGRDDGGAGTFTPLVGMILEGLTSSVISGNAMHEGYLEQMFLDKGGHGEGFILKDNTGCPMTPPE